MRITGVNIFSYLNTGQKRYFDVQPNNDVALKNSYGNDSIIKQPSFTALSPHGEFRYMAHNHVIHCFYCRKPLIYGGDVLKMQQDGLFSGEVKYFIEAIKPYKKHLRDGRRTVFERIERYGQLAPQTHLQQIIQYMYSGSLKKLRKVQADIFKDLALASKTLPEDRQIQFRKFMKKYHKRLYEIPYNEEFDGDTFAYKIQKKTETISNEELRNYIKRITKPLANDIFRDDNAIIPEEIKRQITSRNIEPTARNLKLYVINRVLRIGERLDRRDIVELCKTAEDMMNGKKVIIPFSNKDFMRDLVGKIFKDYKKDCTYYNMMEIASRLPNSSSSMNSFVVKHKLSDSDTIGFKLLEPTTVTVEHVKPLAEGGEDIPENWVHACKHDNNTRGHRALYEVLSKFPERNQQYYFDDMVKLSRQHVMTPQRVYGMAKTVEREGNIRIKLPDDIEGAVNK